MQYVGIKKANSGIQLREMQHSRTERQDLAEEHI
jgi:hypothetical protein